MFSISIRILAASVVAGLTGIAFGAPASSASPITATHQTAGWQATWTTAQHHPVPGYEVPNWSTTGFADQTVRQVVRVSTGGVALRIRLSNRFGTTPLRVSGATIGKSASGARVQPGSLRRLSFGRKPSVAIPAGGELVSDPIVLTTRSLDSLTISLHFAGATGATTFHESAQATTYRAAGDHQLDPRADAFTETTRSWYVLAGVDTVGRRPPGAVVAFGDSITDGYGTTPDANNRYPDQLAERLARRAPLGVVNAGISGNKLLASSPCYGEAGITRFSRDALEQPGVRAVVVLAGINDIGGGGFPDFGCGASPVMTAEQVINAHRTLIQAAHAEGVRVIGATMLPIKGAYGFDTPANEAVRDAVNTWIRESGEYDAVADVDAALANPADPDALLPAYDSGDRVHPNDRGADRIARTVEPAVRTALRS